VLETTVAHPRGGSQGVFVPSSRRFALKIRGRRRTTGGAMSPPIQLISTDFDGTLFAEFENPPVPKSLQAIIGSLQARGAKWVINTGRDLSSLMETLGRAHVTIHPDYLVTVEREIYRRDGSRYLGLQEWNHRCARSHEELFERVRADVPRLMEWINERFTATLYVDPYSPFCLIAESNDDADAILTYLTDYARAVPHLAIVRNIISRSGSWYSYGDVRIAQGRDNVRVYMKENPEFYAEVEKKLREDLVQSRDGKDPKKEGGADSPDDRAADPQLDI